MYGNLETQPEVKETDIHDPLKKYFVESADEAEEETYSSGDSDNEVNALVLTGLAQPVEKSRRRKPYLIYPNDRTRFAWDVIISITLLFFCILTPYNLAMELEGEVHKFHI